MYKPLVVRLVRKGDKLYRVYRIVVTSLDPVRKGGEIACVGFINPRVGEWQIVVDSERLAMWVNRGAQVKANAGKYIGLVTLYPPALV